MKELKLKIEKFDKAIAFQVLKMNGTFEDSEHVGFSSYHAIIRNEIILNKHTDTATLGIAYFNDNEERDIVFNNIIKWISDEQFSRPQTDLVVGEEALFSDAVGSAGVRAKLVYILPEEFKSRYLSAVDSYPYWCCWKYARPTQKVLKVEGNIYHWRGDNE